MKKDIGVVGLGTMGSNCTRKLLEKGFEPHGYDLFETARARAAKNGVHVHASLSELGTCCSLIILFVPGPKDVEKVILGEGGLSSALQPGSIIINMSTVDPGVNIRVGTELQKAGIQLLDAPVLGSPSGVGSWAFAVGGEAEAVHSASPVFEALSGTLEKVFYLGALGNGNKLKLLNNMMLGAINACAAEILALAEHMGVPQTKLVDVAVAANARTLSNVYREIGSRVAEERYGSPTFTVDMLTKDVHLCMEMAKEYKAPLIVGAAVDYVNQLAASQKMGALDHAVMWKAIRNTWKEQPEAPGVEA